MGSIDFVRQVTDSHLWLRPRLLPQVGWGDIFAGGLSCSLRAVDSEFTIFANVFEADVETLGNA